MEIWVFIAPCFCFSLSAYSGKDRFSEAVVPVGVRTTSPASSPADVNSVEVKIVPTENIPAGTSTRMKGKGKYRLHCICTNIIYTVLFRASWRTSISHRLIIFSLKLVRLQRIQGVQQGKKDTGCSTLKGAVHSLTVTRKILLTINSLQSIN